MATGKKKPPPLWKPGQMPNKKGKAGPWKAGSDERAAQIVRRAARSEGRKGMRTPPIPKYKKAVKTLGAKRAAKIVTRTQARVDAATKRSKKK